MLFHTGLKICLLYLLNAQINTIKLTTGRTCVLIAILLLLTIITSVQRYAKSIQVVKVI